MGSADRRPTRTAAVAVAVAAIVLIGLGVVGIVLATGDDDGDGQADGGDRTLPPPGVVCTQIACSSEAQVRLAGVPARARRARVCVSGRCGDAQPVDGPAPFASAPVPERARERGRVVRVTLELIDAQGDAIRRVTRRAAVRRVRPNGPRCPPVCFQLHLRYDADTGALAPAPSRF